MAHDAQPQWREPGQRPVTELILAEQIVVWALRRYRAAGERLEGLAGTFRQVFGLGGVEAALAAAGQVIGALERHSRRTDSPPRMDAAGAANDSGIHWLYLSHTELSVLRLMAAAQRNDSLTAVAVVAWLARPAGQRQLLDGARAFAACLTAAGQHLPGEPDDLTSAAVPRGAALPSAYRSTDLQPDEKLVLTAMRLWVRRAMQNECGGRVLYRHLAEHGAAEAAPGLHGMLYNLGTAARRPIDMRCPNCRGLSPDEARLLHALASAQAARDDGVLEVMLELLAPAAARLTVEPARGAARALAMSGVALPLREWDFATLALEAAPSAEPSPLQAGEFECDDHCDDEAARGSPRVLH